MRNYLKQFEAWVTKLRDDPFVRARVRLTFLISFGLILFFLATLFAFNGIRKIELERIIDIDTLGAPAQASIDAINRDMNQILFWMFVVIVTGSVFLSYFFSMQVLNPIKKIVRAQKRFIADSSHELRTPLSIMKINSELAIMEGDSLSAKESLATLKSNVEEIDRMSSIIENLLRLAYYDTKSADIPYSEVDLSEIVKNIVDKTRSLALNKNIELSIAQAEKAPILGNSISLEQLVMNLVRNAIQYTNPGGSVIVGIKSKNASYFQFNVRDTGIGIPEIDLPHIFDPFYKASTNTGDTGGKSSGLGLTIVKKIVDRHRAQIEIESTVGKGTNIIVNFPKFEA